MPKNRPVVHVQLKLAPETHERLTERAKREEKSMHRLILELIEDYIAPPEKEANPPA